jgi:tetratricopeptide (TPR) repeat protein
VKRLFLHLLLFSFFLKSGFGTESRGNDLFFESGYASLARGEFRKALTDFFRFVEEEKKYPSPRYDKMIMIYRFQSVCLDNLSLYPMAVAALQDALELCRQTGDSAQMAVCNERMASLFRKQGKPGQAELFLNEALTYYQSVNWLSRMQELFLEIGRLSFDNGDFEQSRQYLLHALEIRGKSYIAFEATYIEDEVFYILGRIAMSGKSKDSPKRLLHQADSACELYIKNIPEKREMLLRIKLALAEYYRQISNFNNARRFLRQAEILCIQPSLEKMKPFTQMERVHLSEALGNHSESEKTADSLFRTLLKQTSVETSPHPEIPETIVNGLIRFCDSQFTRTGDISFILRKIELL